METVEVEKARLNQRAGDMEARFFQLLETDRASEAFLVRFWELDRMLEAAMAADGAHPAGQELGRRR